MKDAREMLGHAVRRLRNDRGESQEAFAAKAEIGRSYMGKIERGEVNVSLDNIQKIAVALGPTLGRLFAEVDRER